MSRERLLQYLGGCELLSEYVCSTDKVLIKCLCGNTFVRSPKVIFRGGGGVRCPLCRYDQQSKKRIIDRDYEKIITDLGGEIVSGDFNKTKDVCKIRCIKHDIVFKVRIGNILDKHWGCPKCSGRYLVSTDEVREIVVARGGVLLSEQILSAIIGINIKCSNGHIFHVSWNKMQSGRWCPVCARSRFVGEEITKQFMEFVYDAPFPKRKPKWLCYEGLRLELDGFNELLKIAFEHDGDQHFRHIDRFHKHISLEQMIERDKAKTRICHEHGVSLLRFKEHKNGTLLLEQFLAQNPIATIKRPEDFVVDLKLAYAGKKIRRKNND